MSQFDDDYRIVRNAFLFDLLPWWIQVPILLIVLVFSLAMLIMIFSSGDFYKILKVVFFEGLIVPAFELFLIPFKAILGIN